MKRFIPTFLVLLALLVGYWAWPFFELRALAAALQVGDVTAINKEVDYPRLRRSFTEQITALICALQAERLSLVHWAL